MSGPHYLLLKLGQFWELKVVSIRHYTREMILQGHKMTLINKRGTAGPRPEGQRKLVEKVHLSERGEKGQISRRTQRPLGRSRLACGRKTDCWALCGCCVISQDSCAVSGRHGSWALGHPHFLTLAIVGHVYVSRLYLVSWFALSETLEQFHRQTSLFSPQGWARLCEWDKGPRTLSTGQNGFFPSSIHLLPSSFLLLSFFHLLLLFIPSFILLYCCDKTPGPSKLESGGLNWLTFPHHCSSSKEVKSG